MLFLALKKKKDDDDEECVSPGKSPSLVPDCHPTPTGAGRAASEPTACPRAWDADRPAAAGSHKKISTQQKLKLDAAALSTGLGAPSNPDRAPPPKAPHSPDYNTEVLTSSIEYSVYRSPGPSQGPPSPEIKKSDSVAAWVGSWILSSL